MEGVLLKGGLLLLISSYHCDWDGGYVPVLQPTFYWQDTMMHTCIIGISTCFQRKTKASENWQKLSKLLLCRSYSGNGDVETPTKLSNEVTEATKIPDFLKILIRAYNFDEKLHSIDKYHWFIQFKLKIFTIFR